MTCRMCRDRPKDWEGSDPRCAFPNGGEFVENNWNCATANAIRDICGEYSDEKRPEGVDFRNWNARMDSGDQKYATIEIDDAIDMPTDTGDWRALCLWVTWYKCRGCTEQMWLLSDDGEPRRPTEADCLAIAAKLAAVSIEPHR